MLIKPKTAAATTTTSPAATACGHCGVEERLLLHNVRHRGAVRRLCTTCVLRLHPRSFCPTCFQVYPPPPSNGAVLTCLKCSSSTHSLCVAAPPGPYICPLCVNPNTPIFKLKAANVEGLSEDCRVMDRDAAKKLMAAAKIVSASMNKAAVAARAEAERQAKEAAFTRKRAKEAIEHVANLVMKEKSRKKEEALVASGKLAGSGLGGVGRDVVQSGGGGFAGTKASPVIVEEKINALNAAEFRGNERTGGSTTQCAASRATADDHQVADAAGENVEAVIVEWSDISDIDQMIFSDEETGAENLDWQTEKQEQRRQ